MKSRDFIFHLAALPRIGPSFERPFEHHKANIDVTIRILQKAATNGIKKIIFSGSSAVYGDPQVVPTGETTKINPLNPYALQKFAAEQYGLLLGRQMDVPLSPFGI